MSRFPPSLLAAALMSAFAAQADEGVNLKLAPALASGPSGEVPEIRPVFLRAREIEGTGEREVHARGDVEARRGRDAVAGDTIDYDRETDVLLVTGNVRLSQEGFEATGSTLRLKLSDRTGFIDDASYRLQQPAGRGTASHIEFQGEDKYRLTDAIYTTCPADAQDWAIHVKDLELDHVVDKGVARHAYVEFMGVPFLYTPWMDFPLSSRRKSGFLTPSFGTTERSGAEVLAPYYFNIAPNRDATLMPRYMSRRGLQVGGEFRYLGPAYNGDVTLEFLDDRETQKERYNLLLRHKQDFGGGLKGNVDFQSVSDDTYFTDLTTRIATTSQTNLLREATLSYEPSDWWRAMLRIQRYQTLQDPLTPVVPPYHRVPQLTLTGERQFGSHVNANLFSEVVNFDHPTLANGTRLTAYPSVAFPVVTSFAYFTPKIGVHATRYLLDRSTTTSPDTTRTLPIFSLDSGVTLERPWEFSGKSFTQTLEPRAYYVYIPHKDQSLIPNFDSAELDLSYAQIFTENQFSGGDRINDANQLTLALTSRLMEPDTGRERLRATVGQRLYLSAQRVTLPGAAPRTSSSTDLLALLSGQVTSSLRLDGGWQFNTDVDSTIKSSIAMQYRPSPAQVLNLSYRFARGSFEQVDVSTQWPISSRLYGLFRWQYSARDDRTLEALGGLEYNGGCWALRTVVQHIATLTDQTSNAFFIQLELNGVSRLGVSPLEALRQSIPGYARTNENAKNPLD